MAFGLLKVLAYCSFGLYLYLECVSVEEDVLDKVIVFDFGEGGPERERNCRLVVLNNLAKCFTTLKQIKT